MFRFFTFFFSLHTQYLIKIVHGIHFHRIIIIGNCSHSTHFLQRYPYSFFVFCLLFSALCGALCYAL